MMRKIFSPITMLISLLHGLMRKMHNGGEHKIRNLTLTLVSVAAFYGVLLWYDMLPAWHINKFTPQEATTLVQKGSLGIVTLYLNDVAILAAIIGGVGLVFWVVAWLTFKPATSAGDSGGTKQTSTKGGKERSPNWHYVKKSGIYPHLVPAYWKRYKENNPYASMADFLDAFDARRNYWVKRTGNETIFSQWDAKIASGEFTLDRLDPFDPEGDPIPVDFSPKPQKETVVTVVDRKLDQAAKEPNTIIKLLIAMLVLIGVGLVVQILEKMIFAVTLGLAAWIAYSVYKYASKKRIKNAYVLTGVSFLVMAMVSGGLLNMVDFSKIGFSALKGDFFNGLNSQATAVPTQEPTAIPEMTVHEVAPLENPVVINPRNYATLRDNILSLESGLNQAHNSLLTVQTRQTAGNGSISRFDALLDGTDELPLGLMILNKSFDVWFEGNGILPGGVVVKEDEGFSDMVRAAAAAEQITAPEAANFIKAANTAHSAHTNMVELVEYLNNASRSYAEYWDLYKAQAEGTPVDTVRMEAAKQQAHAFWDEAEIYAQLYNQDVDSYNSLGYGKLFKFENYVQFYVDAAENNRITITYTATPSPRTDPPASSPTEDAQGSNSGRSYCDPNAPNASDGIEGWLSLAWNVDPPVDYATWQPCDNGRYKITVHLTTGTVAWLWSDSPPPEIPQGAKFKMDPNNQNTPMLVQ